MLINTRNWIIAASATFANNKFYDLRVHLLWSCALFCSLIFGYKLCMKTNFSSTKLFTCRMFALSTSKQLHVLNLLTNPLATSCKGFCVPDTTNVFPKTVHNTAHIFITKYKKLVKKDAFAKLLFFFLQAQYRLWFHDLHICSNICFFPNIPSSLPNPACFTSTSLNILAYPCTKPVFSSNAFKNAPLPQQGF